jgi:choline transport protein
MEQQLCQLESWPAHSNVVLCWCDAFVKTLHLRLTNFIGFDGAVHMSEEVRKAKEAVPRAMFLTNVINGCLAYAMTIVILYTMGPLEDALKWTFPIIEICLQATGSAKAATAMVCGLLIISLSVNLASIASVSRLTWAWSRDVALPTWFSAVSVNHCRFHHSLEGIN